MRKKLVKLTPKQSKLIDITIDNAISKDKKTKTKKSMLLEAGYSPKSAHNAELILSSETIQAELARRTALTVKRLEDSRDMALSELSHKIKKAPYNHLMNGIDITTRNIQLLSGKSTENHAIKIEISQEIADKYKQGSNE